MIASQIEAYRQFQNRLMVAVPEPVAQKVLRLILTSNTRPSLKYSKAKYKVQIKFLKWTLNYLSMINWQKTISGSFLLLPAVYKIMSGQILSIVLPLWIAASSSF